MFQPSLRLTAAAVLFATLAACSNSGDSAPPPTGVTATPGDGRIVLSWDSEPGIEYWVFGAADPGVTVDNWSKLPESFGQIRARNPQPLCALTNGTEYWATINARTGTSPGGPGTEAVGASPRMAGEQWSTRALPTAIKGLGFALVDYCSTVNANSDSDRPATGEFIAVGEAASIYTSPDGLSWTRQSLAADESFDLDLYAVAVDTARPGAYDRLEQTWFALGAQSSLLISNNGADWRSALAPTAEFPELRALARRNDRFVAVGDGGRIASFARNQNNWVERPSRTTADLEFVTYEAGSFVATGAGGTLLMSGDGNGWTRIELGTGARLRGAAYGNNNANPGNGGEEEIHTWVAVGEAGTVARSTDGGRKWEVYSLPGQPDLVGVGYTTAFIAVDATGGVWRSIDGASWQGPLASGLGTVSAVSGLSQYGILTALPGNRVAISF